MEFKLILSLMVMITAIVAVLLPNKWIDTASCKRNWIVVLTVLSSASFIVDKNIAGVLFALILIFGVCLNWLSLFVSGPIKHKELNHDRH
ncbi:hypothetical protein [Acinetobacter indicus]|uniref:hypothetical protein n=1 Tax=Acinetobacter indicus TaxID=756892 RepID=UPI00209ACF4B|nr:hypothetical protein [Acinetobacter indicus]MCO8088237.1 hypothetical protein [Acinetobacter indicus]